MRAANAVMEVVDRARALDDALARAGNTDTPPRERAWLQEVCYGACRHYHRFDAMLALLLRKPLKANDRAVHFILVNACHQLENMRTPDYAAVAQSVEAVKGTRLAWAGDLINAVLRNFVARRAELAQQLAPSAQASFPSWLHRDIAAQWHAHADAVFAASNAKPPLTLRVNRRRASRDEYLAQLARHGIAAAKTADSALGVTLEQPLAVERIPGFADGLASVQDESSQLALDALGADALRAGARVLDACAAPGGKTGLLLEAHPTLQMVALDLPKRIGAVRDNLSRLGLDSDAVQVIGGDLLQPDDWWDGRAFDCIVLDAPCSATGVIRRHPDIKHRRREDDIAQFAAQQLELLTRAWALLADGGTLLYLTCSILPAENDAVIESFLQRAHSYSGNARVETLNAPSGIAAAHGIQRLPGVHPGDGFYYCRLRKLNLSDA